MSIQKAFQPNRDVPLLNSNGTMNPKWDSYFDLLRQNSNEDGGLVQEAIDAIYGLLSPSINNLSAQVFSQRKEVQDIIQHVASLLASVGSLNARLSESTKARSIRAESSAYQMLDNDAGVKADASGGNFDVNLPDPTRNAGKEYFLTNSGGTGAVTLKPFASETIGGTSLLTIPAMFPQTTASVKSDGVDYIIT